jgi:hypothetical protein
MQQLKARNADQAVAGVFFGGCLAAFNAELNCLDFKNAVMMIRE